MLEREAKASLFLFNVILDCLQFNVNSIFEKKLKNGFKRKNK